MMNFDIDYARSNNINYEYVMLDMWTKSVMVVKMLSLEKEDETITLTISDYLKHVKFNMQEKMILISYNKYNHFNQYANDSLRYEPIEILIKFTSFGWKKIIRFLYKNKERIVHCQLESLWKDEYINKINSWCMAYYEA